MTRSPHSNPYSKLKIGALEGAEETVSEPKKGTPAVLNLDE
jgi:hypothetical protein